MTRRARPGPVAIAELDRSQLEAWADLAERAAEPNPYLHPDFVTAAARLEQAEHAVGVAISGDSSGWTACLPVRHRRRWRRVPLPGTLSFHHDQSFLGTPLVDGANPAGAVAGLLEALGACKGVFSEIDHCDAEGPVGRALDQALPATARRFGRYERAALLRRPEPTYLEGRLKGKHRRSLSRLARDLAAQCDGELQLDDRAGDPTAVSEFLDLEAAGWKGERGTALARLPGGHEFFESICRDFADRGALQLLFLSAGGRTVATRCNLRSGDAILCFKIAHDEQLNRFSPGMQMELRMIEHFHADLTAERMDSCADPGSEMFNRLWPDRKQLGGVAVPSPRPSGRVALPVLSAVGRAIDRNRAPAPAGATAVQR